MNNLLQRIVGILVFVALGTYGVMALRGPNGLSALAAKRKHIQQLQDHNASLAAENETKRKRIEMLRNDRATQDLEIRERLKLVKPGETQFIVPDSGSSEGKTSQPPAAASRK